jgi:hypothetical protein
VVAAPGEIGAVDAWDGSVAVVLDPGMGRS